MSIKIGNLDIASIKVGSADCKVYIGNELLYPSGFTGKFKATYASGPDYTLDCDGNTTLTTGNTKPSGYSYANMIEAVIGNCVTSIGAKAFDTCRSLNRVNSDVNGVYNIPNGVTSIGKNAFDGNFSCSRIMFPNTLTTIGDCAFIRCYGLTSITIPNSVTSIYGNPFSTCSGLTNITVDSNNTKYDSRNNCNAIIETSTNKLISGCKNTIIPNSVTSIGNSAFTGCYGLTAIDVPNSITSIGSSAFNACRSLTSCTISNSVTKIPYEAFYGCSGLTSINIPSGVTRIDESAFSGCTSLTAIDIPNSVTSIIDNAFGRCNSLTSCTIGSGVTYIGSNAFGNCRSLTSIDIPNSVTSIGSQAFNACRSLTSCTIGSGVISINNSAFYGCSGLTSIAIPSGVTYIGSNVFGNCGSLTSITVDSSNTKYNSMNNCNAIIETSKNKLLFGCKNTVIPNSVTSIGDSAFYICASLTSIVIPNSVTSIGSNAFYGCSGLTSVTVNATTPPTLGSGAFNNTNNCPIYVPAASVETYKTASGWSTYASRIVAIPTPSLTWVQFNSGDTINGLNYYGIKGAANAIGNTFTVVAGEDIVFDYIRNMVDVTISNCYSETITPAETNVEYVFSNIGCSDYYTINNLQTAYSSFELLIMQ